MQKTCESFVRENRYPRCVPLACVFTRQCLQQLTTKTDEQTNRYSSHARKPIEPRHSQLLNFSKSLNGTASPQDGPTTSNVPAWIE